MAATWRATQGAVAFANAKSMLDLFNATSSARIIRAYQIFCFNDNTSAITGVLTTLQVRRITAASSGTTVTPMKHDSNSSALDANTTCGTNRTVTGTDVFRRLVWSNEEPTTTGSGQNNLETMLPFGEVFNAGIGSVDIEPIVCRATQGVELNHTGTSTVATVAAEIIFTDAAT